MQALGDVLLDQYSEAITNTWYMSDHDPSFAREHEVATALRDEGLRALIDGKPTDPLTLARIAIFEGHFTEGVKLANDALAADPGLYEAHYLVGSAYAELGATVGRAGKHDEALGDFQQADREFAAGSAIARSSPELYSGACRALELELDDRLQAPNATATFTSARAACARALVARPGDIIASVVIGYLDQVRAAAMMERGGDPESLLQDGFAVVAAALETEPNNFLLLDARSVLALMAAKFDIRRDRDPRPNLVVAEQAATAANALVADTHAADLLGQIAALRAEDALGRGEDPRAFTSHAVELLKHGDSTRRQVFVGRALVARATWETQHDLDPHEALDGAISAFQKARVASPHNMGVVDEEGGAWQAKAEWERKNGVDNVASLDRAIACSETVLAADGDDLEGHANLGGVLVMRAEAEITRKGDARPFLEQALAHLDRAHAIDQSAEDVKTSIASARKLMAELEQKK
jgi:tetratricopeptide (TPR) repeat protein